MSGEPRAAPRPCTQYRPGKVGHCAGCNGSPRPRAMSSSQSGVRRSAWQVISGWLPVLAKLPGLGFSSAVTCCVTGAASSLLPMVRTLAQSKPISDTDRSNRRCATRHWRLIGSRTSGRTRATAGTLVRAFSHPHGDGTQLHGPHHHAPLKSTGWRQTASQTLDGSNSSRLVVTYQVGRMAAVIALVRHHRDLEKRSR